MNKIIAIAWLLICLLPVRGLAEESVASSTAGMSSPVALLEGEQNGSDPLLLEARTSDEELVQIVGHGFASPLCFFSVFSRKIELPGAKIKLWDEASRGVHLLDLSVGRPISQKISLSVMGSR